MDESVLPSMGDEALGVITHLHYSAALDTPTNKRFLPAYRAKYGMVPSYYSVSTPLSGTLASSIGTASVNLANATNIISATATFATSVASLGTPMMIGGEEVKWIRMAATYGGGFSVTYITASGREVLVK